MEYWWEAADWGSGADKIPRAEGNYIIEVVTVGLKRTTFPNKGEARLKVTLDIGDG